MIYDPDAGPSITDRLNLDGNPEIGDDWPTYKLDYIDENGKEQTMTLPLTIADWAATEKRFGKHFRRINPDKLKGELVPYHEYLNLPAEDSEGKTPFIYILTKAKRLDRLSVSKEIVMLGKERLDFWSELREMSGDKIPEDVREQLTEELEEQFEARLAEIRAAYESRIENLKQTYPQDVARRMAEALIGQGGSVESFVTAVTSNPALPARVPGGNGPQLARGAPVAAVTVVAEEDVDEDIGLGPWIDEETCTACDDCMAINSKLFVYNENKKAVITDPKLGTYKDLVVAAERCPSGSIHPGTPLNKKERDLAKWVERAAPFNE
jgi:pyruvate-ferredoxin/flavodoxin oxidoreductase